MFCVWNTVARINAGTVRFLQTADTLTLFYAQFSILCCACDLVQFMHKNNLLGSGEDRVFGWKYLFLLLHSAGNCPEVSLKICCDVTLTNVEAQLKPQEQAWQFTNFDGI